MTAFVPAFKAVCVAWAICATLTVSPLSLRPRPSDCAWENTYVAGVLGSDKVTLLPPTRVIYREKDGYWKQQLVWMNLTPYPITPVGGAYYATGYCRP